MAFRLCTGNCPPCILCGLTCSVVFFFFFLNDPAPTEFYPFPLPAPLRIPAAFAFAFRARLLRHWLDPLPAVVVLVFASACIAPSLLARPHILALPALELWAAGLLLAR